MINDLLDNDFFINNPVNEEYENRTRRISRRQRQREQFEKRRNEARKRLRFLGKKGLKADEEPIIYVSEFGSGYIGVKENSPKNKKQAPKKSLKAKAQARMKKLNINLQLQTFGDYYNGIVMTYDYDDQISTSRKSLNYGRQRFNRKPKKQAQAS